MKNLKVILVIVFAMVANIGKTQKAEFIVNGKTLLIDEWSESKYSAWYYVYDVILPTTTTEVEVSLLGKKSSDRFYAEFSYDSTFVQSSIDDQYFLKSEIYGYGPNYVLDKTTIYRDINKDRMFYTLTFSPNTYGRFAYVRIIFKDGVTSTSETLSDFLTFQNPVTNTLKLNTDFDCDVQIYNQNGQLVNETKTTANSDNAIDFSDKPVGVYFMEVRKGSAVFREKVIKE